MDHLIVINTKKPGGHTFGDHIAHGGLIFFKDMVDGGSLDLSDKLHCECLWFCFSKLIQNELDQVNTGIAITSGFQNIIHHLAFLINYISCQKV